jgi:hypothetical protein
VSPQKMTLGIGYDNHIILLIFFGLTASAQDNLVGIYFSKNEPNTYSFIFNSDSSFVIIHKSDLYFLYTDTLSFGTYKKISSNIVELNSTYQYFPLCKTCDFTNIEVIESIGGCQDSVYFIIDNEFENTYHKNGNRGIPLFYSFNGDGRILYPNKFQISQKEFNHSRFYLDIIPDNKIFHGELTLTSIQSPEYILQNHESNIFHINFPAINSKYLTCLRLTSEYLILIDNKTIKWHNEVFRKNSISDDPASANF